MEDFIANDMECFVFIKLISFPNENEVSKCLQGKQYTRDYTRPETSWNGQSASIFIIINMETAARETSTDKARVRRISRFGLATYSNVIWAGNWKMPKAKCLFHENLRANSQQYNMVQIYLQEDTTIHFGESFTSRYI